MQVDLAQTQWVDVTNGHITAPDGLRWARRSTRTRRSTCDELISSGAPLVLYYFGGGQLDWFDGEDATAMWAQVRHRTTSSPRSRGDLAWTAGLWVDVDDRELVFLTGHC